MSTIDVTDRLVLHEEDVFAFRDETGFLLEGDNAPQLINAGRVSLSMTAPDPDHQVALIACTAADAMVWNKAGGVMSLHAADSAGPGEFAIQMVGEGVALRNGGKAAFESERALVGTLTAGLGSRFVNGGLWRVEAHDRAGGAYLGADTQVLNSGKFEVVSHDDEAFGVYVVGTGNGDKFVNSGLIHVTGFSSAAGVILWDADPQYHLINSGRIVVESLGLPSYAVTMPADGLGILDNSGLIRADVAIRSTFSLGAQTILNSGKLVGDVMLAQADDDLANSGVIKGDVFLGGGFDRYDGADGVLRGVLWGGGDNDTLIGGRGGEKIHGDDANADLFDGADLIKGGGGADTLFGGGGADTLKGGDNADFLHGEAGADLLDGGGGSDVYVFTALSDSAPDAADTILSLKANDWIDLSPIDADPDKPGDQAFSPDQVTLSIDKATGETRIEIDADGDTTADFLLFVAAGQVSFDQLVL